MDRKKFIKTCGLACLGGATSALLFESCASANYFAKTTASNNQITVRKSEFMRLIQEKPQYRKFVLARHEKFSYPIIIFRLDEENYSALLMQCTHNGCELQAQGDYLVCPCHGSEFTHKGVVQNPPAEQDLTSFEIKTDRENVYLSI